MAKESGSPEQAVSEIEAALRSMESLASKPPAGGKAGMTRRSAKGPESKPVRESTRSVPGTLLRWLAAILASVILPLLILVRFSVWLYTDYGLWPWVSVMGGAMGCALVFIMLALVLIRTATGSFRAPRYLKRAVLGLVLVYCGYSASYVSVANVKTEQVQETYTSFHPSLRLALSTWVLADSRLVITDAERESEDYARMGLPQNEASLHMVTSSGYVHAVDLRTINRPEWRNLLTTVYFKTMGFTARRHTGTADHLHVSIPVAD